MDRAIGAPSQRLTQHLGRTGRTCRTHDDFTVVLLAKPQCLFERVRIGLVHLVAGILLAHASTRVVDARLPFPDGNLLDADGNFHWHYCKLSVFSYQFSVKAPKETDNS